MYENEFGNVEKTENSNSRVTGTYTDYVGYSQNSTNIGNVPGDTPKRTKAPFIAGAAAILLAGIIAGAGVSYAFINNQKTETQTNETAEIADQKQESVGLQKADTADNEKIEEVAEAVGEAEVDESEIQSTTLQTTGEKSSMTVQQIADKCLSSVVAITNKGVREVRSMWGTYSQESQSAGSGVIIGQTENELLILTNYHVVADNNELSVVFSWEENENAEDTDIIKAVVKDYDANRDISVIAIKMDELSEDTISKITVATIGSSDQLALGEQVVAIGNALGYGQSVTTGIVSALNRVIKTSSLVDSSSVVENTFIQTDAAINPGNSGGALFNMRGELVGVNSAKSGYSGVEGMGYAIPISDIMDDVENMMNQEIREDVPVAERGYLGVTIVDVTPEISATYGMPLGIYVSSVNSGSGAEKAGMLKEDIITAVEGKKISSSAELKDYLASYRIGEKVTVTIERRGEDGYVAQDIDVVLGKSVQEALQASEEEKKEKESEQKDNQQMPNGGSSFFDFGFPFGNGYNFGD